MENSQESHESISPNPIGIESLTEKMKIAGVDDLQTESVKKKEEAPAPLGLPDPDEEAYELRRKYGFVARVFQLGPEGGNPEEAELYRQISADKPNLKWIMKVLRPDYDPSSDDDSDLEEEKESDEEFDREYDELNAW